MAFRDQPLGELALTIPRASALFRQYDMDYCCGGKQTLARAVEGTDPAGVLVDALDFLGQGPPPGLAGSGLAAVWAWARQNWTMARVPHRRVVPAPRYG